MDFGSDTQSLSIGKPADGRQRLRLRLKAVNGVGMSWRGTWYDERPRTLMSSGAVKLTKRQGVLDVASRRMGPGRYVETDRRTAAENESGRPIRERGRIIGARSTESQ
ncbi:MAG: hypothetical protein DWQ45_02300 [Planctomycetota bacterium]|nr:MAG: hypothetical protein DWQ29_06410 [Planctomycetota bacterium]REK31320.1 MAG: hypothetical protein DWQ41_00260 [Planctomycetota bacterium]REK39045.1 MAG: hypothetical protein DWQ45_02300 [Planctomycetota bacterium]